MSLWATSAASAAPVSFRNDVMAVLSKAGCNMGSCHGNQSGKAGFKLSLRGEDADYDFNSLTHDYFARRVDPLNPDQSLLLLKATTQLAHEGGLRFTKDSPEYAIFRRWIAEGAKSDTTNAPTLQKLEVSPTEKILAGTDQKVQFQVRAKFSDGTTRDVTSMAVYEPVHPIVKISHDGLAQRDNLGETTVLVRYLNIQIPVRLAFIPARPGYKWQGVTAQNYIDEQVFTKLKTLRMNPSAVCNDSIYLRRAYLDLLGILPTAAEAKAFLADKRPDKRTQLIDQLLARPEYADFWALKWSDLLRVEEKVLDHKGVQVFHDWIRKSIAENKPLDQFARELVSARGSTYTNAPANYYRANRDAVTRGETTAQLFLGTRLLCAKCHNHPFEHWTQDDYYDWAELFARVDYKIIENDRKDKNDEHEFVGEQVVFIADKGDVANPRTGKNARPRFLGVKEIDASNAQERLDALANWIGSPDNPLFVRSQVNRIWFHLMGRGLVDPIDDFRSTNLPSHPALLDALAKDFVAHKFDVRYLIRLIMSSKTYQLSAQPNDTNLDDEINFSHTIPHRLSAEQVLDAESQVTGSALKLNGYPAGTRASQIAGVAGANRRGRSGDSDQFLQTFGKPPRLVPSECERSCETTMGQAFQLISGQTINELLTANENRLTSLLTSGKSNEEVVTELYWTALSREPNKAELKVATQRLADAKERRYALEDITWALLNAKEFVLRY